MEEKNYVFFHDSYDIFVKNILNLSAKELDSIRKEYDHRSDICRFMYFITKYNLKDKLSVVAKANGKLHLTDCVWCNDKTRVGPDTCHCHIALLDAQTYVCEKYGLILEKEEERLRNQICNLIEKCNFNIRIPNFLK